eukprot:6476219-Amphidinium_carterae.1
MTGSREDVALRTQRWVMARGAPQRWESLYVVYDKYFGLALRESALDREEWAAQETAFVQHWCAKWREPYAPPR